jgi:hypothetical protein
MRGKSRENQSRLGRGTAQVVHQQHAAVRAQLAIDQCTDVMIPLRKMRFPPILERAARALVIATCGRA